MASTNSSDYPRSAASVNEGRRAANSVSQTRARVTRSVEELEKAIAAIREARDTVLARNLELSGKLAAAQERVSELEYELEAADEARDASLQLVQDLSRESDELRLQIANFTAENERLLAARREAEPAAAAPPVTIDDSEIHALRRDLAEAEAVSELARAQSAKNAAALGAQLASAQRARDIAVASVTNAQRQVERLAGERRALQTQLEGERATFEARLAQLQTQPALPAAVVEETVAADPVSGVVLDGEKDAMALLRACLETLAAMPADRAILAELEERFQGCTASASGAGHAGIARFSSACGELTRWLGKTPRKVEATIPTLRDAVTLLAELSAFSHPERIADPAGALVYSVDDDPDNCECIAMSLEKMSLRTRYAMKPEIALGELVESPCEIIILDVDLPGMSGFELCECVRATDRHRITPVVFLSGLMSTQERLASLPGGGYTFIPKPYNLNELGVKVLGVILQARLAKAAATSPGV